MPLCLFVSAILGDPAAWLLSTPLSSYLITCEHMDRQIRPVPSYVLNPGVLSPTLAQATQHTLL